MSNSTTSFATLYQGIHSLSPLPYILICNGNRFIVVHESSKQLIAGPELAPNTSQDYTSIPSDSFPTDLINGVAFHHESSQLAVISNDKTVWVYDVCSWSVKHHRSVIKRATSVLFTPSGDSLLISDKFGDVYRYNVSSGLNPLRLLLGHVSLITDMLLSPNGEYLVTSDRDEKVRVSKYSSAFEIESFCLGHTEFISCLHFLPGDKLVSGGNDPFLLVWDYVTGRVLQKVDIPTLVKDVCPVVSLAVRDSTLVLSLEKQNCIQVWSVGLEDGALSYSHSLEIPSGEERVFDVAFDSLGRLWMSGLQGSYCLVGSVSGQDTKWDRVSSLLEVPRLERECLMEDVVEYRKRSVPQGEYTHRDTHKNKNVKKDNKQDKKQDKKDNKQDKKQDKKEDKEQDKKRKRSGGE